VPEAERQFPNRQFLRSNTDPGQRYRSDRRDTYLYKLCLYCPPSLARQTRDCRSLGTAAFWNNGNGRDHCPQRDSRHHHNQRQGGHPQLKSGFSGGLELFNFNIDGDRSMALPLQDARDYLILHTHVVFRENAHAVHPTPSPLQHACVVADCHTAWRIRDQDRIQGEPASVLEPHTRAGLVCDLQSLQCEAIPRGDALARVILAFYQVPSCAFGSGSKPSA